MKICMLDQLEYGLVPVWRSGYKLQFEPSQKTYVILYPEGLIRLNETASIIAQQINGKHSIYLILKNIKTIYESTAEIEQDVLDYLFIAHQQHWIDFI